MVAGHLQEKKGLFYIVLSFNDVTGKRATKWIPTGLPVKGNKKRTEELLCDVKADFVPETPPEKDTLFATYLEQWLAITKSTVALTTYASYCELARSAILPYFKANQKTLGGLRATDIQTFYTKQLERVSANTVIHYHAIIHKALKYAVKIDLIASNPADKIDRPRKERFIGSFYDKDEMHKLFEAAKGTKLELIVMLGAFYGLRRSEILGLKWNAIDFTNNTLTVRHTVTTCNLDGKQIIVIADRTKTKSSMRTLPLVKEFRNRLLTLYADQEFHRKMCGRYYNMEYFGYVCVDEMGNLIKPNYVTDCFSRILRDNRLRKIRFHDLRHSCASLLLANGVPMKQIQEWLGHSDFSTTANIYAHLDYNSKLTSAQAMLNGLGMGESLQAVEVCDEAKASYEDTGDRRELAIATSRL